MTDLGTYQVSIPMEISYPEPQFRADARPLFDELRAKFLAGMADVYDRYAEKARQKYNEIDPATERPAIARGSVIAMPFAVTEIVQKVAGTPIRFKNAKKKSAKPVAKRKRK